MLSKFHTFFWFLYSYFSYCKTQNGRSEHSTDLWNPRIFIFTSAARIKCSQWDKHIILTQPFVGPWSSNKSTRSYFATTTCRRATFWCARTPRGLNWSLLTLSTALTTIAALTWLITSPSGNTTTPRPTIPSSKKDPTADRLRSKR